MNMGRKIGATRPLQFGDVAMQVKVSWDAWHALQDAVKAADEEELVGQDRDRRDVQIAEDFCIACVKSWDVTDEDGTVLPVTAENLRLAFAPSEVVLLQNRLMMPPEELLPNTRGARSG